VADFKPLLISCLNFHGKTEGDVNVEVSEAEK
jgi:hypothetical protein